MRMARAGWSVVAAALIVLAQPTVAGAQAVTVTDRCVGTDHPPFERQYPPGGASYVLVGASTNLPPGSTVLGSLTGPGAGAPQEAVVDDTGRVVVALPIDQFGTYRYTLTTDDGRPVLSGEHVVDRSEPACGTAQLTPAATATTAAPTTAAPTTAAPTTAPPTTASPTSSASVTATTATAEPASDSSNRGLYTALIVAGLLILLLGGGVLLTGGTRERKRREQGAPGGVAIPTDGDPRDEATSGCDWAAYYDQDGTRIRLRAARTTECCYYVFTIRTTILDGSATEETDDHVWSRSEQVEDRDHIVHTKVRREITRSRVSGAGPGVLLSAEVRNEPAPSIRVGAPTDVGSPVGGLDIRREVEAMATGRDLSEVDPKARRVTIPSGYKVVGSGTRDHSAAADVEERTDITVRLVRGCPAQPGEPHRYGAVGTSEMEFGIAASCGEADLEDRWTCDNTFQGSNPVAASWVSGDLSYPVAELKAGTSEAATAGGFTVSTEAPSAKLSASASAGPIEVSPGSISVSYSTPSDHNQTRLPLRWTGSNATPTIPGLDLGVSVHNRASTEVSAQFAESWSDDHSLAVVQTLRTWHRISVTGSTLTDQHEMNHRSQPCHGGECTCLPSFTMRVGTEAPELDHHERASRASAPSALADASIVVDGREFLFRRPALAPPTGDDAADTTAAWTLDEASSPSATR